jgi:hypothetical protein
MKLPSRIMIFGPKDDGMASGKAPIALLVTTAGSSLDYL